MFDVSFNNSSSNAFICGMGGANALDGKPNLSLDDGSRLLRKKCAFQRILCVTLTTFLFIYLFIYLTTLLVP